VISFAAVDQYLQSVTIEANKVKENREKELYL